MSVIENIPVSLPIPIMRSTEESSPVAASRPAVSVSVEDRVLQLISRMKAFDTLSGQARAWETAFLHHFADLNSFENRLVAAKALVVLRNEVIIPAHCYVDYKAQLEQILIQTLPAGVSLTGFLDQFENEDERVVKQTLASQEIWCQQQRDAIDLSSHGRSVEAAAARFENVKKELQALREGRVLHVQTVSPQEDKLMEEVVVNPRVRGAADQNRTFDSWLGKQVHNLKLSSHC